MHAPTLAKTPEARHHTHRGRDVVKSSTKARIRPPSLYVTGEQSETTGCPSCLWRGGIRGSGAGIELVAQKPLLIHLTTANSAASDEPRRRPWWTHQTV